MFYKTVDKVIKDLNQALEDLKDITARELANASAFEVEAERQQDNVNYAEQEAERAERVSRKIKELLG